MQTSLRCAYEQVQHQPYYEYANQQQQVQQRGESVEPSSCESTTSTSISIASAPPPPPPPIDTVADSDSQLQNLAFKTSNYHNVEVQQQRYFACNTNQVAIENQYSAPIYDCDLNKHYDLSSGNQQHQEYTQLHAYHHSQSDNCSYYELGPPLAEHSSQHGQVQTGDQQNFLTPNQKMIELQEAYHQQQQQVYSGYLVDQSNTSYHYEDQVNNSQDQHSYTTFASYNQDEKPTTFTTTNTQLEEQPQVCYQTLNRDDYQRDTYQLVNPVDYQQPKEQQQEQYQQTTISSTPHHDDLHSSSSSSSSSSTFDGCESVDSQLPRDEKKAKEANIPLTYNEIVNLSIDQFNEHITRFHFTEAQLTLMKDIRRRGKNKVAAQTCRKRKMEQIVELQHEVGHLAGKRMALSCERSQLIQEHQRLTKEHEQLYAMIQDHMIQQQQVAAFQAAARHGEPNCEIAAPLQLQHQVDFGVQ